MKKFFDKYTIILIILCFIGLLFFIGHYSNILIDVGREVYYPEQLLKGKVLYKDIFNIYGPLSYQINALFYYIFGAKLSVLYFWGSLCSVSIVLLLYKISRQYLSDFLSFSISVFAMSVGVFTTGLFNFHFPYSWAILYGLVSFLLSLYFLIKFEDNNDDTNLCLSAVFCGMCATFKYDFLLYSLVVLYFIFKNKNIKALLCLLSVPFISYGILFLQGLRVSDILNTFVIYKSMANSLTLKYFYQNSGIYFHPKAILTDISLFLFFAIPFGLMVFSGYIYAKNKMLSNYLVIIDCLVIILWFMQVKNYIFGFLPILVLCLSIFSFRKLTAKELIIIISSLLVSVKVFWVLLLNSYGNYYVSVLLIALMIILFQYLPKNIENRISVFVLFLSILAAGYNIENRISAEYKITSQKGTIYTTENLAKSTQELIDDLRLKQKKTVVIFPEGLIINFLSNTQSDNFYNSLLPLYIETFSQKTIKEHFKKTQPEYIVLNNLDMKDYYYRYICTDYAQEFCSFIKSNYELNKIIDDNFRYMVFKRLNK